MLSNIILTLGEDVTGNFSNLEKMLKSKGIVEGTENYWHYKRKRFPFMLEETGEKVWKLPRL
jgi:hypothetical protein